MLFKMLGQRLAKAMPVVLRDGAGFVGVGLVAYGAYLVHPAAGFIAGGGLLIVGVMLLSGGNSPPPNQAA